MTLVPATVLTGFLGAGKTTLLKRILSEQHGQRIAVIENEFGEENVDGEILVADTREQIIQLSNGCICCTIRDDLRSTLRNLVQKRRTGELQFERVVIETTGLADPGPVAQTFFLDADIATSYLLDAILTLVDAKHAALALNDRQEARRQVGFADHIFISKTDLVTKDELDALSRRLARMNLRATQKAVHFGEVPISEVFDLHSFNLNATLDIDSAFLEDAGSDHAHNCRADGAHCDHSVHGHHHDDDVMSFAFRSDRAFDQSRLGELLGAIVNSYGPTMLRYKGILNIDGTHRKVIFQGVHQLMSTDLGPIWGADEKRTSKLVFIGIQLPREKFMHGLEQCLI